MNVDPRSAAIGGLLVLGAWGAWYAGSTRPAIDRLVQEKAEATGRANTLQQENAKLQAAGEHWFAVAQALQAQAPPSSANAQNSADAADPAVAMLNLVRPGLGTVVGKIAQALPQTKPAAAVPDPPPVRHCPDGMAFIEGKGCVNPCPQGVGVVWNGFQCVAEKP